MRFPLAGLTSQPKFKIASNVLHMGSRGWRVWAGLVSQCPSAHISMSQPVLDKYLLLVTVAAISGDHRKSSGNSDKQHLPHTGGNPSLEQTQTFSGTEDKRHLPHTEGNPSLEQTQTFSGNSDKQHLPHTEGNPSLEQTQTFSGTEDNAYRF